jgi:hypothetical protein
MYPAKLAWRAAAMSLDSLGPWANRLVALAFLNPQAKISTYNMNAGTPPSEFI